MTSSLATDPARKIPCAPRRRAVPAGVAALDGRGKMASALIVALVALLLVGVQAAHAARPGRPAHPARRPKIEAASVSQKGRDLVLTVRTAKPVAPAKLKARPDARRASAAYLCFGFAAVPEATGSDRPSGGAAEATGSDAPSGGSAETRICVGGPKARTRAGLVEVSADGRPIAHTSLRARLKRPKATKLVLSIVAGPTHPTGLAPGHYTWRVLAASGRCEVRQDCTATYPAERTRAFRLRSVRAVGCTGGSAELVTAADTGRKVLALTFDDGPSEYTDRYLDVLREKGVPATFFEIGQEMPGRERTMGRILAEGDEIGDHTENHVEYPGYAQIADAANRIEDYTGFRPCLFRPPGGAVNSDVVATAGSLGMKTVTWDVDPRDWSLPGTSEIYSNIVDNAGPGSIILMHDGGGPRDETLAALPEIIDTLRAKGYGFETVSALLGDELVYRPFG